MTDTTTAHGSLKAAFAALLRGDTAARDRLCDRAGALLAAEDLAAATQRALAVDFYVRRDGTAIPTRVLARAAGVLQ